MIYTNTTFKGRYPVGTAAVVSANTPEEAAELLNATLKQDGLVGSVKPEDMIPFRVHGSVRILCDGNY